MKVLIIEDEPKVSSFIKKGLEEYNYEAVIAPDGHSGEKQAISKKWDIIILDINLPGLNGFDVCKSIRENNLETPVLMLTALGTTDQKLTGFEAGADDYLVKPFEFKELLARIKALIKRTKIPPQQENGLIITAGDLVMNLEEKSVKRNNKKIDLTAKEFALLEYLIKNKNKIVSRALIAEKVWDIRFDTGTNVIDVYVNFLRRKIDKGFDQKLIHTHIGMGYILKDPEPETLT